MNNYVEQTLFFHLSNSNSHEILKRVSVKNLKSVASTSKQMKKYANEEALYRVLNRSTTAKQMKELAKYYGVAPIFGPRTLKSIILKKLKIGI